MLRPNEITRIAKDAITAAKRATSNDDAYAKYVREYVSGHAHTNKEYTTILAETNRLDNV